MKPKNPKKSMKSKKQGRRPNWRLIRKRGKWSPGTVDYEKVYLKNGRWVCVIGRVGEKRQVLGPYEKQEDAQAEADTWRSMRLAMRPPISGNA